MRETTAERAVLLAASYPPRDYRTRADSQEIAAAVKALLGAVFARGWQLVFGGHPTISPLVLMIAREYGEKHRVAIYQSSYFRHHLTPGTRALVEEGYGQIEWVPEDPDEPAPGPDAVVNPVNSPRSLSAMRLRMVAHPGLTALVLAGGDTGLLEEARLFRQASDRMREPSGLRPILPIGGPGGVAQEMGPEAHAPGLEPELFFALQHSRNYLFLCSRLLGYLERLSPRLA